MSTPSSTNTKPAMGWEIATTISAAASADCTAGSELKSGGKTEWAASTRIPRMPPPTTPHNSMVRVADRAAVASPAPRALPVNACPAMANASRANARKVQTVADTW